MKVWKVGDKGIPAGAVYVGRPSKWGNPFRIGDDGDRAEVIEKYMHWIYQPTQDWLRYRAREELFGKDLVCFCAPKACHADTLMEIANAAVE